MRPHGRSARRIGTLAAAALALLGAAGTAGAQPRPGGDHEWVEVNAIEGARGYVDRRSIRREGGILRLEGRILYHQPDEDGVVELSHSMEIDCGRREYRVVRLDALDAGGNVVMRIPPDAEGTPINDGSPNAALHAEFCG